MKLSRSIRNSQSCECTKELVDKVAEQLATRGVRDTEFVDAASLNGGELVAIVQNNINKKILLSEITTAYSHPPIVRFGRWWLYSPEYERYISTPLMANESDNNLWMLTQSGQTITHDFNTLPSVTTMTLMDNKLQQILLNVTYPTKNTIQVNWNGDMTVYVYII